jgi:hypothetical protein
MLIHLWEIWKTTARIVYWKTAFLVRIYRWYGYEVDSEWWRITELSFICQSLPLSSSLMKYLILQFPSSTLLALYRKVNNPQIYTRNLLTPINTFFLAAVILLIPYSQALRIRRICSTDTSLIKWLGQLINHLKRRGYKQSIIKKSFSKAYSISRSSLLQHKENRKCKRTPCVLTYHPCPRNSFNTICEHWTSVEKNSKLSKVFPWPPMVAFKQPNTLRNLLVRAEISKPNATIDKSHSCGDKRCKCCRHM